MRLKQQKLTHQPQHSAQLSKTVILITANFDNKEGRGTLGRDGQLIPQYSEPLALHLSQLRKPRCPRTCRLRFGDSNWTDSPNSERTGGKGVQC